MPQEINISLPDDYLMELGKIVYCWAKLEDVVDICLSKLLDISFYDTRSAILFAHTGFKAKLEILSSLFAQLLPTNPRLETYPTIINQLRAAQTARNSAIHARWGIDGETGEVKKARIEARTKLKASVEAVPLRDLVETRHKITDASYSLFSLLILPGNAQPDSNAPQRGQ